MSRFRKAESVSEAPSGDALMLVHLDRGTAYRLNGTARLMWELAVAGWSAEEIGDSLAARLETSPDRLHADATALMDQLVSEALLEPAGGAR